MISPVLTARLSEFPKLTATRLLEEIRAAGYAGGYTQLKQYVRGARPAPPPDPVVPDPTVLLFEAPIENDWISISPP